VEIFSIIIKILSLLIKPFMFICKYTGLHISLIAGQLISFVNIAYILLVSIIFFRDVPQDQKINLFFSNSPILIGLIVLDLFLGIIAFFIWLKYIIRLAKKDRTWTYSKKKRNKKSQRISNEVNPNINNNLTMHKPEGFIFGKKGNQYISKREYEDGHILIIGGAGSGKSSCIAIPSLMSWKERIFAIDIKGELSEKTKQSRKNFKIFNPADEMAAGYDPYYMLNSSTNLVQDIKEIAIAIIPLPEAVKDPFWIQSAQNIFTACILHYYNLHFTFIDTMTAIQSTSLQSLIDTLSNSQSLEARMFVNQIIGLDMKVVSGIYTEIANKIMLFATDEQLKRALSKNDTLSPKDIENGKDIYISIEESKLEQWKGLLTLIVSQFLKHFERRKEQDTTPVLFLLDEFARLGKIELVINGLATLRSKKITIAILTQSLAQLDALYGKSQRQIIADNCQYKAILKATDVDTQEYFSKLVGTYDKTKQSHTNNYDYYVGMGNNKGTSTTTEEKRIIKPEQFAYLQDIILFTPLGWYRIEKTPYYLEYDFISKVDKFFALDSTPMTTESLIEIVKLATEKGKILKKEIDKLRKKDQYKNMSDMEITNIINNSKPQTFKSNFKTEEIKSNALSDDEILKLVNNEYFVK